MVPQIILGFTLNATRPGFYVVMTETHCFQNVSHTTEPPPLKKIVAGHPSPDVNKGRGSLTSQQVLCTSFTVHSLSTSISFTRERERERERAPSS